MTQIELRTEIAALITSQRPGHHNRFSIRHRLLALTYLRGLPYRAVEWSCHQTPYGPFVAECAGVPPEAVETWLQTPPTPEMVARHQAVREAARRAKRAAREKRLAARQAVAS